MHMPTILEEVETFIVHFSEGAILVVETERIFVTFPSCCKTTVLNVVIISWGCAILFKI